MEQTRTSVFDRLLGRNEPAGYSIGNYHQQDDIIQNIRRDLQALLNTRKAPATVMMEDMPALKESLLNYGVQDFATFNPTSDIDRKKLKFTLENLINTYEPRLKEVEVKLLKNTDELDFRIRFHIDAILCIESIEVPVQFDSVMEASPLHFDIKDAHYE